MVRVDDRRYEVHVAADREWSDELEARLLAAVEKWLYDHGIESTIVHTDRGDVVLTRPQGAA